MKAIHYILLSILTFSFIISCNYTRKIVDGKTAYERKQYAVAAPMLEKEYKKAKDNKSKGELAFLAGRSYDKTNQLEKALEWYKYAHTNRYGTEALKEYAYALKENELYLEAVDAFQELSEELGNSYAYRKEVNACKTAIKWKKEKKKNDYKVSLSEFNSPNADYSPVWYNEDEIIISSDRSSIEGANTFNWTGNDFSDLFIVNTKTNEIRPFSEDINSEYNEGTLTFNADKSKVIFSRCGTGGGEDDYCKLLIAEKEGSSWSEPKVLPFVLEKVNYAHPYWKGNILYFVADEDEGWGGYDIYTVEYSNSGWLESRLLGANINTELDDMFPWFNADTLYFASEGHGGMGGLDIWRSEMTNGIFSKVENMKAPINSGADDFGFILRQVNDGKIAEQGFLSSNRKEGIGGDDIYAFTKNIPVIIPEPVDTIPVVVIPEPETKIITLEVYVLGKTYSNPNDPKSAFLGNLPLSDVSLQITSPSGNKTVSTDEEGKYVLDIDQEASYRFFASQKDYYNKTANFSARNRPEKEVYQLEIVLDKIRKNGEKYLQLII
ncbi:MAG: flagellar motor protein MotB [Saprospiraceae bacterium]